MDGRKLLIAKGKVFSCMISSIIFCFRRGPTWSKLLHTSEVLKVGKWKRGKSFICQSSILDFLFYVLFWFNFWTLNIKILANCSLVLSFARMTVCHEHWIQFHVNCLLLSKRLQAKRWSLVVLGWFCAPCQAQGIEITWFFLYKTCKLHIIWCTSQFLTIL